MPKRKERILTAELEPASLKVLYDQVNAARESTREERHCLDRAYAEMSKILGAHHKIGDGKIKFKNWNKIEKAGLDQYEFSHAAVIGFKVAMTQYLLGAGDPKEGNAVLSLRMEMLDLAACFSKKFVEAFKKSAKIEDTDPDEVELEDVFDESESPDLKKVEDESAEDVPKAG